MLLSFRQHEFSFDENAVRSGTKVYRMKVRVYRNNFANRFFRIPA